MQGISRIDTEWILFDKKGNIQSKSSNKISLLFEEETFIKDLCFWWKSKNALAYGIVSKKRPTLIHDIVPNSFYEIIGEVGHFIGFFLLKNYRLLKLLLSIQMDIQFV